MNKETTIPEEAKQKIETEVAARYPDFKDTQQEINFREGCEYGYSLAQQEIEKANNDLKGVVEASHDNIEQLIEERENVKILLDACKSANNLLQQEIERLKGLLYKEFFDRRNPYKTDLRISNEWKQFKTTQNL